jgi:hypothetical protein
MDEHKMPTTRDELDALIDERIAEALQRFIVALKKRLEQS